MKKLLTCLFFFGVVTLSSLSGQMTTSVPAGQKADELAITAQDNPEQRVQVTRNLTSMALAFTQNLGQWNEQVLFSFRISYTRTSVNMRRYNGGNQNLLFASAIRLSS